MKCVLVSPYFCVIAMPAASQFLGNLVVSPKIFSLLPTDVLQVDVHSNVCHNLHSVVAIMGDYDYEMNVYIQEGRI